MLREADVGGELGGYLSTVRPDVADVAPCEPQARRGRKSERCEEDDAEGMQWTLKDNEPADGPAQTMTQYIPQKFSRPQ
jgi:hypothetical protein